MTAVGVFEAMKTAVSYHLGKDSVEGLTVNVQGAGSVGQPLTDLLLDHGAKVRIADINASRLVKWADNKNVDIVSADEIAHAPCDVFAPCTLGGVNTKIICGSANNPLWDANLDVVLRERGILYAPDFIVNSGGAIFDADRLGPGGVNHVRGESKVRAIGETLRKILELAESEKLGTFRAAEVYAERRIQSVGAAQRLRSF